MIQKSVASVVTGEETTRLDQAVVTPLRRDFNLRHAAAVLLVGGLLCSPTAQAAKHKRQPKPVVELVAAGKVVHNNTPTEGAVVYLEDPKSLAIKSYLTEANGEFHFSNISPQTDYEVWAEQNGIESKHKFISQFSSHTKFVFVLKLQPKGKHKLLGIL